MMEKLAKAGEGGGVAGPPTFTLFTTTYKVAVHAPAERSDTLTPFLLYRYVVCDSYLYKISNISTQTSFQ
jgi:hypothetical protein